MPDRELVKNNEQNDNLLSDYAITRRQSRSLYRNWAIISKKSLGPLQSQTNVFSKISTSSIDNECVDHHRESSSSLNEDRADEIVRTIEQIHSLSDDNPKLHSERLESLREMTEYLSLKRSVKKKLFKSMNATNKTLGFSKRLKYNLGILLFKIPVTIRHFKSSFELWYSSLKVIEGHFGSNVASYFKFLRKLFLLNACIFILMLFFIMIPQLLFRLFQYVDDNEIVENSIYRNYSESNKANSSFNFHNEQAIASPLVMVKSNPYKENEKFRLGNLFTGEGFLTNTILFYGYYTNTSFQLIKDHSYNIPAAYFFTCIVCYLIIFFFLFISVAVSYRKCYIEASRGMHNFFSNKIFCGWDFGIATKQAADLKSKSIYIDIKELLDELSKPTKRKTCLNTFYTTAISFSLNGLLLFLFGLGGMYSWKYLDQQMTKADIATTMMMWLILTLVIAIAPVLFTLIAHLEGFESPSSALYMTLIRTFTLYGIVIAVVVAYRLNRSGETECWETILGQDMFRLVVLDFIFGSIGTALSELIRYRIFIKMWRGIGCPEFDIARSTMNLIYNQTLFYIGLFFSPVLALLITTKLFIIFYIKKWGAIYNCRPFVKPWKASQAHTVYLSIAFFAFFCVVIAFGYIITSVKTSDCGPFRGQKFIYEAAIEIFSNNNSSVLMIFYYITRPGVVGIALMALVLGVYYMRAVALARIHVVKHLRYLLRLKAEERKLLLNEISKYTKNRDPPDDSAPGGFPDIGSPDCKVPDSKESSPKAEKIGKKIFEGGELNTTKHIFLSMSNLLNENGTRTLREGKINNKFNSIQNIHCCHSKDSIELQHPLNRRQSFQKENIEENPIFNYEHNSEGGSVKSFLGDNKTGDFQTSLLEESSSLNWPDDCGVTRLNFNPVFVESFAPDSGDEANYDSIKIINRKSTKERSNDNGDDKKPLAEHNDDFPPRSSHSKNYFKGDERVPSRMTFNLDKKSTVAKKQH